VKLFDEDIFSVGNPSFSRLRRSREKDVAKLFAYHYSNLTLDDVKIYQNNGNEINANNYRIDISGKSYLYKNFIALKDVGMLAQTFDICEHLNSSKVPVPQLIQTKCGEFCHLDESGKMWCLMEFKRGKYFSGESNAELISVGTAIGRLSVQLRNYNINKYPLRQIQHFNGYESTYVKMAENRLRWVSMFGSSNAKYLEANWLSVGKVCEFILKQQNSFIDVGRYANHIDLHPHNILVLDGAVSSIVDMDSIAMDYKCVPIAFALFKLIRQAISNRLKRGESSTIKFLPSLCFDSVAQEDPEILGLRSSLYLGAMMEIYRRLNGIFDLNLSAHNTRWNHVLSIHLKGLQECEMIFNDIV
jgi:Ser/Thr protein kinase RdoA (MazF antagonist)